MIQNKNIHLTYNETFGLGGDILRANHELKRDFLSKAAKELKKEWLDFFSRDSKNCYFQICHSEGALIVRNALKSLFNDPKYKELTQRVIVLSIAPAAYISQDICHSVTHYCSSRDFVPLLDSNEMKNNRHNTTFLKAHKDANIWDHDFDSPTYREEIREGLLDYTKNPRGKK